jgi:hypothetical protein
MVIRTLRAVAFFVGCAIALALSPAFARGRSGPPAPGRLSLAGAGGPSSMASILAAMDDNTSPLGLFLQARRARLRPEDAGLRPYDERRGVPRLRREEVAGLAG